jgi:hypothetical protein
MEPLALGMQNLRLAQLFSGERGTGSGDERRLYAGLQFLKRSLKTVVYFHEGQTEGLEPSALTEAKYTRVTIVRLGLPRDYKSYRSYLEQLAASLEQFIVQGHAIQEQDRKALEKYFSVVGEAILSDVLDDSISEFEFAQGESGASPLGIENVHV